MNTRGRRPAAFLFALVFAAAAAAFSGCGGGPTTSATITMHHSRFVPGVVTVRAGSDVAFTLRNTDPIAHEWMVGGPEMHERHRTGTEPEHNERPGEVSVRALTTRVTSLRFEQPGEYAFVCHLPGHEAYGMRGVVRVVAP